MAFQKSTSSARLAWPAVAKATAGIAKAAALTIAVASCSPNVVVVVDPGEVPLPVHRYSFDGTGTTVLDSIGTANGTVVGGQLGGKGTLTLAGGPGAQAPYVALPHGLLRPLFDATLEAWVNWTGSGSSDQPQTPWQRIFDFGEGSTGVEGAQAAPGVPAQSYLFLTPQSAPRNANEVPWTRVALQVPHDPQSVSLETVVNATPLTVGVDTHVGVVMDAVHHQMSLFVNGAIVGSVAVTQDDPLSYVYDINDWLGRSQFPADDGFAGTFIEFRIYAAALTPAQVKASYDAGPDAVL